jgi:hypothetical protein
MTASRLAIVALFASIPAIASAQVCQGDGSFVRGAMHLGARAVTSPETQRYGVAAGAGSGDGRWIVGTASQAEHDDVDGTSTAFGGTVGLSRVHRLLGKLQFCPVGSLEYQYGPDTSVENSPGIFAESSIRRRTAALGLALGGQLPIVRALKLNPSVNVSMVWNSTTVKDRLRRGRGDRNGLVTAATGLVLHDALVIRPSVAVPFSGVEDDPVWGLGVRYIFKR